MSPEALEQRDEVLGSVAKVKEFYRRWQHRATEQVLKAFGVLKSVKQDLYGEYSFFLWRNTHVEEFSAGNPDLPPVWDLLAYQ